MKFNYDDKNSYLRQTAFEPRTLRSVCTHVISELPPQFKVKKTIRHTRIIRGAKIASVFIKLCFMNFASLLSLVHDNFLGKLYSIAEYILFACKPYNTFQMIVKIDRN